MNYTIHYKIMFHQRSFYLLEMFHQRSFYLLGMFHQRKF